MLLSVSAPPIFLCGPYWVTVCLEVTGYMYIPKRTVTLSASREAPLCLLHMYYNIIMYGTYIISVCISLKGFGCSPWQQHQLPTGVSQLLNYRIAGYFRGWKIS